MHSSISHSFCSSDDNTELALLQCFNYLSLFQLLNVQRVCKSWCRVARHPLLWQHLVLVDLPVSQQVSGRIITLANPLMPLIYRLCVELHHIVVALKQYICKVSLSFRYIYYLYVVICTFIRLF